MEEQARTAGVPRRDPTRGTQAIHGSASGFLSSTVDFFSALAGRRNKQGIGYPSPGKQGRSLTYSDVKGTSEWDLGRN